MIAAHSGKNQDCQHIFGKNMIDSTFWEKTDWQNILERKNLIDSTFWGKT
jgi:hypothetical protein